MLLQTIFLLGFSFAICNCLNQLSFSGGGAFGAVEIGIAKRLMENDINKKYNLYNKKIKLWILKLKKRLSPNIKKEKVV
jgi:hypothetical protein